MLRKSLSLLLPLFLAFNAGMFLWSCLLTWQATEQHPMSGKLLDIQGVTMHVLDTRLAGNTSETTLVLLHGASTSLLDFSTNLQPQMAEQRRTISIDRPGHGYSDRGDATLMATGSEIQQAPEGYWMNPQLQAELIAQTLKSLNVSDAVLLGHSWAGSVVLAALLQDHDHIKAGILLAGVSHPWQGDSAWHVEMAARPFVGTLFSWQFIAPVGRRVMDDVVDDVFSPENVPENYIDDTGLHLSLRPPAFQHNAEDRTRLSDFLQGQSTRYATITKPLLSIASSEDKIVPAWNHHNRLVQQIEHMQSVVMAGAGHAPHHTRTQEVIDTINVFLDTLD